MSQNLSAADMAVMESLSGSSYTGNSNSGFGSQFGDTTYVNCNFGGSPLDTVVDTVSENVHDLPELSSGRSIGASIGYGLATAVVGVLTFGVTIVAQIIWHSGKGLYNLGAEDRVKLREVKEADYIDVQVKEPKKLSQWDKDQIEYHSELLELEELKNKRNQMELVNLRVAEMTKEAKKAQMIEEGYANNIIKKPAPNTSIYDHLHQVK